MTVLSFAAIFATVASGECARQGCANGPQSGNDHDHEDDVLKITIANKILLLTLNRPERRNALSKALLAALRSALIAADRDPEVSLVAITGAGTAFCSGVDLKDARSIDESGERYRGPLHEPERASPR